MLYSLVHKTQSGDSGMHNFDRRQSPIYGRTFIGECQYERTNHMYLQADRHMKLVL